MEFTQLPETCCTVVQAVTGRYTHTLTEDWFSWEYALKDASGQVITAGIALGFRDYGEALAEAVEAAETPTEPELLRMAREVQRELSARSWAANRNTPPT